MKTKLLKVIRANFDIEWKLVNIHKPSLGSSWHIKLKDCNEWSIAGNNTFDLIVTMLECIYPQGRHYAIMRHSRRFKQARRKEVVKVVEIACVVGFATLVIIAILNSCCGSGEQY